MFWMIFSVVLKKLCYQVFLVNLTVVSVLLSASVERCFVQSSLGEAKKMESSLDSKKEVLPYIVLVFLLICRLQFFQKK